MTTESVAEYVVRVASWVAFCACVGALIGGPRPGWLWGLTFALGALGVHFMTEDDE